MKADYTTGLSRKAALEDDEHCLRKYSASQLRPPLRVQKDESLLTFNSSPIGSQFQLDFYRESGLIASLQRRKNYHNE